MTPFPQVPRRSTICGARLNVPPGVKRRTTESSRILGHVDPIPPHPRRCRHLGSGLRPALNPDGAELQRHQSCGRRARAAVRESTRQRVVFKFGNSAELKARIEKGEAFDVAILTAPLIGELVALGKLSAPTRTDIARAGAGMAVHAQATKPDISTPDALKGALVNARSIAYVGQGATAVIMQSIFEKFGLTEAMNAKTRLVPQRRACRGGEGSRARIHADQRDPERPRRGAGGAVAAGTCRSTPRSRRRGARPRRQRRPRPSSGS